MFLMSDTFPFRFMLEMCVHFDFWNKKFFELFKGSSYDLEIFHFFRKIKNLKNTPNHRGDPLKNSKNFLFQKSKCTHISSINLKGKVSDTKNIVIVFCNNPYGTPCTYVILKSSKLKIWRILKYNQVIFKVH